MKKFFALAALGLVAFGTNAYAFIGGDNPNTPQDETCVTCDELETDELDFDVCTYVAVPLCVDAVETDIILDCLYRPGYYKNPTAFAGTSGIAATIVNNTLDPSGALANDNPGQVGRIEIGGDENDDVRVQFNGLVNGNITMTHTAHVGQNTDNVDNPVTFLFTVWAYQHYFVPAPVNASVPPTVPAPPSVFATATLHDMSTIPGGAFTARIGNGNVGAQVNTGAGFLGLLLGGKANIQPGQQRGEYTGGFSMDIAYLP